MKVPRTFAANNGRKPTVLLADDHSLVLESVSAILADDFDIVAAVSDGRQALQASLRLDPDVIVLDVTMPELDGFQTANELKRAGSRATIVFLTMHQADEYVAAAVNSGAQGYVLKTRIHSDLAGALDHAIGGRVVVPSLTSLLAVADANGAGQHAAHFRGNGRLYLDDQGQVPEPGAPARRLGGSGRDRGDAHHFRTTAARGRLGHRRDHGKGTLSPDRRGRGLVAVAARWTARTPARWRRLSPASIVRAPRQRDRSRASPSTARCRCC